MGDKPCTALVRYEPRAFQTAVCTQVYVGGHRFRRVAGWLCACGMRWPRGKLAHQIPECTVKAD